MKNAKSNNLIIANFALWLVAALIYPVARWIPTSSGMPPKIYDVLIPIVVMTLGIASTSFLRAALKSSDRE